MNGIIYGYARVSAKDQNEARQLIALKTFGICQTRIFLDKQSGRDFQRPQYQRLLKRLKKGDTLVVKSIDRLGRNYNDILSEWQHITKEIRADILVLDMELLDTRQKAGDLTGTLIADLVLQIFAYVAQTEREFICQRQAEGIAAAKRNGRKFGRPSLEMPEEFETICKQCERGELSTRRAAEMLRVSHTTFYRKYKKRMQESVSNSRL